MMAEHQGVPATQLLSMRRSFKAPKDAVFRAFVDPEKLKLWYGPRGFTIEIDRFEARVGGPYRLCMIAPDQSRHWLRGEFLVIEPHDRVVMTWIWEQGDMANVETLVSVRLAAQGERTELVLEHSRLPSEASARAHEGGWSSSFECLEELMAAQGR